MTEPEPKCPYCGKWSPEKCDMGGGRRTPECYERQLAQRTAELAEAKSQRDQLMASEDELQCDIASAFGWDMKGEEFGHAIRRVVKENAALKVQVARLRKTEAAAVVVLGHHDTGTCAAGRQSGWEALASALGPLEGHDREAMKINLGAVEGAEP